MGGSRTLQIATIALHVVAAAIWLGSMAFVALVLVPELRRSPAPTRRELLARTGRRLRALAWTLFALLIATGTAQLGFRGVRLVDAADVLWSGRFGEALAIKLALFGGVVALAAWHDFRIGPRALATSPESPAAEALRRRASLAGRAIFLLGIAIFTVAVALARGGF